MSVNEVWNVIKADKKLQAKLMELAIATTTYMNAALTYFPGDGLSSHFTTPGGIPMTSYRYNMGGDLLTCSVVEGESVALPKKVADHISKVTDPTWPETYWTPRDMTSHEYMTNIGPNHDGSSFGLVEALAAKGVNVDKKDIFRPTMWQRFGQDDYRACAALGPMYM